MNILRTLSKGMKIDRMRIPKHANPTCKTTWIHNLMLIKTHKMPFAFHPLKRGMCFQYENNIWLMNPNKFNKIPFRILITRTSYIPRKNF
uniref:Transposon TX1 uncharacterized n=1 Tax=Rhizophora mucronata TaxID=61149 RepID=A0A2P2J3Y4_RHIMU